MFCAGGKVTKSEVKQTKNGKSYLAFTVAENKGWGETKETTWYDCMSWDTATDLLACKVLVFGQLSQREYQEKTYNNIDVFHVEVVEGPSAATPDVKLHAVKKAVPQAIQATQKKQLPEIPF